MRGISMNASEQHPSKFRTALKELLPAYIITFVFCYMLFVFEPLLMYSTNQLDFWFDLALMALPMLGGFAIFFFAGVLILTAVFLINKAVVKEKEPTVFRIITVILFFVFFAMYIQGNFLAGDLPALDGSVIDWSSFGTNDLVTLGVCVLLIGAAVFLLVKFKVKRTVHFTSIASVVVFAVITISLAVELISCNAFVRKDSVITTTTDFDTISSDKNFVVLLNDAIGSSEFRSVLEENPEYK